MALSAQPSGRHAGINITPLIDVVLVLLIIFMVASPDHRHALGIQVSSPAAAPGPDVVRDPLILRVAAGGALALASAPIARTDLAAAARREIAARESKVVFFDVEDDANYGDVVALMDTCRAAGARTIAVVTR